MSSKNLFAVVLLLVGILSVGWLIFRDRPDPLVVQAMELANQMAHDDADPKLYEEYSELLEGFSREQIMEMERRQGESHTKDLKRFFALSDEEQQAKLDAVIDEQDARIKKYRENLKKEKKTKPDAESRDQRESGEIVTYTPSQLTREAQELRTRYGTALTMRRLARKDLQRVQR
jgi:hypothetical protein